MSKVITIPKNRNPFEIMINKRSYTYKAGETVEVPDDVANAIENALALEPKPGIYLSKFAQLVEGSISEINEEELSGIKNLTNYAFYNCDNLTKVTIPEGVKTVGGYVFSYCALLTEVVLPASITSIDGRAFTEDKGLKVIVKAPTPPTLRDETAKYIPTDCVIYVPAKSVEAYKAATEWSTIANQIVAMEE